MAELDDANMKLRALSENLQHRVDEATAELQQNLAELQEAKDRLEAEQRTREQFISMVVHEISQPLTAITAYSQLLQRVDLPAPSRDRASHGIVTEARRLARLSRDLSYASQLARNTFEIAASPIDIAALVREQADLARIGQEDQPLDLSVPPQPVWISGDPDRLAQVISNLLANAFRYAGGGQIKVHLAASGKEVILSVSDSGPGIDPSQIDMVFEPYVQLRNQGGETGTAGLGLYISRAIVEAHEGRIWVDSEVGQGTTFQVVLPVRSAPRAKPAVR
jgi:signal transduction histidine kinase